MQQAEEMSWLPLVVIVLCAACTGVAALSIAETEPPPIRPMEDFILSDPVLPNYPTSTTPTPTSPSTPAATPTPTRRPSSCSSGQTFGDPESCARFFVCFQGRSLLMQCPGQLLFNDPIGVCDWPRNVRCAADRPTAAETRGVAVDRWGKVRCVASEGFYASPRDCGEFFRCHRGSAHRFVCARGLVFNDVYKTCDWPWNVRDGGTGRGWRACRFSKRWLV
ncbi:putative chitinase 10 [Amblyomma americanum]